MTPGLGRARRQHFTLKIRLRGTWLFVEARLTFSSALGACGRLGAKFALPPSQRPRRSHPHALHIHTPAGRALYS